MNPKGNVSCEWNNCRRSTHLEEVTRVSWSSRGCCDIIKDKVDHEVHSTTMELSRELLEVGSCAKVGIELGNVRDPVPMVCVAIWCPNLEVFVYGRYPYWNRAGQSEEMETKSPRALAVKPAASM
jgi:hypothetical protein